MKGHLHKDVGSVNAMVVMCTRPSIPSLVCVLSRVTEDIEKPVDLLRALGPILDGDFYRYNGSEGAKVAKDKRKRFCASFG